jgi:hypothetical protein
LAVFVSVVHLCIFLSCWRWLEIDIFCWPPIKEEVLLRQIAEKSSSKPLTNWLSTVL